MNAEGQLFRFKNLWVIDASPYIMGMFARLFPKASIHPKEGKYTKRPRSITHNKNACRELEWLRMRFELEMDPFEEQDLVEGADGHREQSNIVKRIAQGLYEKVQLLLPLRDYQQVAVALNNAVERLLVADAIGLGKQHAVDTKVLTPDRGWVEIGRVKVGDAVISSAGAATTITGVFPQGVKPSYRVTFSDHSSVEAGPEHLWAVTYRAGGRRDQKLVLTTDQLRLRGPLELTWTTGTRKKTVIDLSKTVLTLPLLSAPVVFAEGGPLLIPPYCTGQLLANGHLVGAAVLTSNAQDADEVRNSLLAEGVVLGATRDHDNVAITGTIGLESLTRKLGINVLSGQKRIPLCYLRALPADRISLLQGLMDGDGSISAVGNKVTYHTTSPGLADDVQELVEALGGIASVRPYDRSAEGKPTDYQVRMRLPKGISPFRVARKASRYKPGKNCLPRRTVTSVEYVRDVESVCIRVAADDKLYCTEHCILTHNTPTGIGVTMLKGAVPAVIVPPNHLCIQWEREINKFVDKPKVLILGGMKERIRGIGSATHFIVPYTRIQAWLPDLLAISPQSLIFDEVHELRHMGTQKYDAAFRLSEVSRFVTGLSATPIYNYGDEIYNIMNVIRPGALGDKEEFSKEWCKLDRVVAEPAVLRSYLINNGFMIYRNRKDVGRELPEINTMVMNVDADLDELAKINDLAAKLAQKALTGGFNEAGSAAREFDTKLRQATGLAKASAVALIARNILLTEEDEKVTLFGWHHAVYDRWRKELAQFNPVFYTGHETAKEKQAAIDAFTKGNSRVFIMSLASGAGVNGLETVSSTAIHGELGWTKKQHEQATGRLQRDGQRKVVNEIYVTINDGSDPPILGILGLKKSQHEGLIDGIVHNDDKLDEQVVETKRLQNAAAEFLQRKGLGFFAKADRRAGLGSELADFISLMRLGFVKEAEMQEKMEGRLESFAARKNEEFIREAKLSEKDRIDFKVGPIGIECKVKGDRSEVYRQVQRYLEHDTLTALVLVCPWPISDFVINGKHVYVVSTAHQALTS